MYSYNLTVFNDYLTCTALGQCCCLGRRSHLLMDLGQLVKIVLQEGDLLFLGGTAHCLFLVRLNLVLGLNQSQTASPFTAGPQQPVTNLFTLSAESWPFRSRNKSAIHLWDQREVTLTFTASTHQYEKPNIHITSASSSLCCGLYYHYVWYTATN